MTLVTHSSFLAQTGAERPSRVNVGAFEDTLADPYRTELLLEVHGASPMWLDEVVKRLNVAADAVSVEEGWSRMTDTAVIRSLQALRLIMSVDSKRPSVTPTPEGGLQFEWHEGGWDIEIEVDPDGRAESWGKHLHNGSTFDGPLTQCLDSLRIALKDVTLHHLTGDDWQHRGDAR